MFSDVANFTTIAESLKEARGSGFKGYSFGFGSGVCRGRLGARVVLSFSGRLVRNGRV